MSVMKRMGDIRRVMITLAYDGANYCGFQKQGRGRPAIQDVLYSAIEAVTGAPPAGFAAAGRTDAGVHALGQVVAVNLGANIPVNRIPHALNRHLPPDVAVVSAAEVVPCFHPRFDAKSKTYAYSFYGWDGKPRHPLLDRHALYVPGRLDLGAMDLAAAALLGRHDFSAFQDVGRPVKDATRDVTVCRVRSGTHSMPPRAGLESAYLEVSAGGFLLHMVRVIAGTVLEVGRGRFAAGDIPAILAGRDRQAAGPTLPAHGLCLVGVEYQTTGPSTPDADDASHCGDAGQTLVDTPRAVS